MKASLTVFFEDPFWVGVFERITNKTIILSAILLAACLLLSGCGGKSAFDGSRTASEIMFRMEYRILDREESAELELTEGDQIQVHILHTCALHSSRVV